MSDSNNLFTDSQMSHHARSNWWRWPLMPIAALTGAIIGTILVGVLQWVGMKLSGSYNEDGWYFKYIVPLVMWGCFGYFLTAISYRVAPAGKIVASAVVATTFCVVMILIVLFGFTRNTPTLIAGLQVILSFGVLVGGATFGIIQARDE